MTSGEKMIWAASWVYWRAVFGRDARDLADRDALSARSACDDVMAARGLVSATGFSGKFPDASEMLREMLAGDVPDAKAEV